MQREQRKKKMIETLFIPPNQKTDILQIHQKCDISQNNPSFTKKKINFLPQLLVEPGGLAATKDDIIGEQANLYFSTIIPFNRSRPL